MYGVRCCTLPMWEIGAPQPQRAVIKEHPSAFVVVELDMDGCRCDDSRYAELSLTPIPQTSAATTNKPPSRPAATLDYLQPLSGLLEAGVYSALEALHANPELGTRLTLGTFLEKDTRGALRMAVRWHFPNLTTVLEDGTGQLIAIPDPVHATLTKAVGCSAADKMTQLSISRSSQTTLQFPFLDTADKDVRREFHAVAQKSLSSLRCRVSDGWVTIQCSRGGSRTETRDESSAKRPRADDSESGYTLLVVQKSNVETSDMKRLIAEFCHMSDGQVGIAGTKDRRAVTWQRVTVSGDHMQRFSKLPIRVYSDVAQEQYVVVHGAARRPNPLQLGDLKGNAFEVTVSLEGIADQDGTVLQELGQRLSLLAEDTHHGFLNYFGPQRFGRATSAAADDDGHDSLPGIAILKRDYVSAWQALIAQAPEEVTGLWKNTLDADQCKRKLNVKTHRDALLAFDCLSIVLKENRWSLSPDDVEGDGSSRWIEVCRLALLRAPFSMRQLWLHAAQSLLFNKTLSVLWERHCEIRGGVMAESIPLLGSMHVVQLSEDTWGEFAASRQVMESMNIPWSEVLQAEVLGVPLRGSKRSTFAKPTRVSICPLVGHDSEARALRLSVRFELPSSAYATVLLRELLGGRFPTDSSPGTTPCSDES